MSTIENRIANLERRMGAGQGKLVVIRGGDDDTEIDALLVENGLVPGDPANLVVVLRTFIERRDGGIGPIMPEPELLYTMPLR